MNFKHLSIFMVTFIMILVTPAFANEVTSQLPTETNNHMSNGLNLSKYLKINSNPSAKNVRSAIKNHNTVSKTVSATKTKEQISPLKKVTVQKTKNNLMDKNAKKITTTSTTSSVKFPATKTKNQETKQIESKDTAKTSESKVLDDVGDARTEAAKTNGSIVTYANDTTINDNSTKSTENSTNNTSNNTSDDSSPSTAKIIKDGSIIGGGVVVAGVAIGTAVAAATASTAAATAAAASLSLAVTLTEAAAAAGALAGSEAAVSGIVAYGVADMAATAAAAAATTAAVATAAAVVVTVVVVAVVVIAILDLCGVIDWW
jgi:hypothetical protein